MYRGHHSSCQEALDEAIEDLRESRKRFDGAEDRLLTSKEYHALNEKEQEDVQMLVLSCKNIMLGNLKWS